MACAPSVFAQSLSDQTLLRGTIANNDDGLPRLPGQTGSGRTDGSRRPADPLTGAVPLRRPLALSDQPQQPSEPQSDLPALYSNDDEEELSSRENTRVRAEQSGAAAAETREDPFAPPGFRLGTSVVNLQVEQSIGYSSNISRTPDGEGGAFSQTDLRIGLRSDWARHELTVDADASYRYPLDSDETDEPAANVAAALRLDLADGFTTTYGATYGFSTESLTSDNLGDNITERPGVHSYGASAEVARTGHRLDLRLRGAIDRTEYEEATLADGSALDQVDRNNNLYTVTGRAAYDYGAAVKPFVQAGVGWRRHDEEVDRNGDQRDSMLYDLRAGFEFDIGEKLQGDIALGYIREEFEEGSLEPLEGISVNGTLNWSPERGTIVTLAASTTPNGSTIAGDNGSIIYSGSLGITRRATDRLALNFDAGVSYDYDEQNSETDVTYTVGAGARYWMSRYMAVSANVEHEIFESDDGGDNYDETTARIGIILQR